jgi:hypothetical protein
MANASLVSRTHQLSQGLARVLSLLPKDVDLSESAASFLFEVRVLTSMVSALDSDGWHVKAVKRQGRLVLHRAPGKKCNASYLQIEKGMTKYQIVTGSQISDRYGEPRAPDISLQQDGAPDEPSCEHVIAIWDAKLRGDTGAADKDRVSDAEFARFVFVHEALDLGPPGTRDAVLGKWPASFQVSGLVTNGTGPSEPSSVFLDKGVSVVEHFANATTPCKPNRSAHLAYRHGLASKSSATSSASAAPQPQLAKPAKGLRK